jgi:hypothetical protein
MLVVSVANVSAVSLLIWCAFAGFSWAEMALCFVVLVCVDASTNKVVHANNQFHLTISR